jgi:hypothetical protein
MWYAIHSASLKACRSIDLSSLFVDPYIHMHSSVSTYMYYYECTVDSLGRPTFFFRPALHADEASLTSDRLVPLNGSVCELPLRIAYSPMSVQVRCSQKSIDCMCRGSRCLMI